MTSLVGRMAQLCNIVSKPELNDTFVLVQSFMADRNRFVVRTMPSPMTEDSPSTIAVKLVSLKKHPQRSFYKTYPHYTEVVVTNFIDILNNIHGRRTGTVLHLGTLPCSEYLLSQLYIRHPCRILGEHAIRELGSSGIPHPKTTLESSILIGPADEENIVEIEDVLFPDNNSFIICTSGRQITFRRCFFQTAGVLVGAWKDTLIFSNPIFTVPTGVDKTVGTPNVVFENCLFESKNVHDGLYGVFVGFDGTARLF